MEQEAQEDGKAAMVVREEVKEEKAEVKGEGMTTTMAEEVPLAVEEAGAEMEEGTVAVLAPVAGPQVLGAETGEGEGCIGTAQVQRPGCQSSNALDVICRVLNIVRCQTSIICCIRARARMREYLP